MKRPTLLPLYVLVFAAIASCQPDSANKSGEGGGLSSLKSAGAKLKADRTCIPGVKLGAITAQTTEADLIYTYGLDNVSRDSLHVGEGYYIPGTKVFANTPDELRIAWKVDSLFEKIARVIVEQPETRWKTETGITIGTPLSKVVQANEVDFYIFGFDWDYSGSVSNWGGGALENLGLGMRFAYNTDLSDLSDEELHKVIGDQEVSTATEVLQKMDLRVAQLYFFFE